VHGEGKPCRVRGKGLNADQSLNEANAQTNEGRNDEQQQQRLSGNSSAKRGNPRHSGVYQGSNSGKDISHESTPLHTNQSLNETDTEADKGNDDKSKNQGIGSDGTNKGANPLYSFGHQGSDIGNDSGNSHGGSRILQNTPFQIKIMLNGSYHG
jgi:hypothetical protein